MKRVADALWVVVFVGLFLGLNSLRRAIRYEDDGTLGIAVLAYSLFVVLPAACMATLVARRRRNHGGARASTPLRRTARLLEPLPTVLRGEVAAYGHPALPSGTS